MAGKAYVVRRQAERQYDFDDIPDPAAQHKAAFADRAAADAHARLLDRQLIATADPVEPNPLDRRPLAELTSLPEFALRDWLLEAGVPPPDPPQLDGTESADEVEWAHRSAWGRWWDEVMAGGLVTPAERFRVWEAFDKITFHEVVEVPADGPPRAPAVFAVVHRDWEYGDDFYYGANEPLAVFRTRAAADAERDRRAAGVEFPGDAERFVVVELAAE